MQDTQRINAQNNYPFQDWVETPVFCIIWGLSCGFIGGFFFTMTKNSSTIF